MPRAFTAAAILLLLMMALLAGGAALRESVTIDEVAHIGAGVSYLQKLDFRLNEEHPPLAKALAALPLVLGGAHADYSHVSWSFSESLFHSMIGEWVFGHWLLTRWNDPRTALMWARLPMLLLTLLLGWILFRIGVRLGGPWGGLFCLAVFACTPAFLAFGPLVLTDAPVTLFSVLTLWTFAGMWISGTRNSTVKFGLSLAGALLCKFSALLLPFGCLAVVLSVRWRRTADLAADRDAFKIWWRRGWRNSFKGLLWASLAVYLVYFVISWNQPSDSLQVFGNNVASLALRRLLMPPWLFLRGLGLFAVMANRPAFILGQTYVHGVWFYFPVLFVLKSPLSFLGLLLLAAVAGVIVRRRRLPWIATGMEFYWRAVWVFLVFFVTVCVLGHLNMSIRHFMFPIALLTLMLAPLPRALASISKAGNWAAAALAVALAVSALQTYPSYLAFLGALSFGQPGYALVNDSNLDWNHALPEVQHFVEQRGLDTVLLDEWGFSEPSVYVPKAQFWNCQEPAPADAGKWAVLSADMIEDGHNCRWLLQYPHEALAAGSMYAFQLPAAFPPAGSPTGPPLPKDFRNLFGFPLGRDSRLIFLNCIRDPQQMQPTFDWMVKTYGPKK